MRFGEKVKTNLICYNIQGCLIHTQIKKNASKKDNDNYAKNEFIN